MSNCDTSTIVAGGNFERNLSVLKDIFCLGSLCALILLYMCRGAIFTNYALRETFAYKQKTCQRVRGLPNPGREGLFVTHTFMQQQFSRLLLKYITRLARQRDSLQCVSKIMRIPLTSSRANNICSKNMAIVLERFFFFL